MLCLRAAKWATKCILQIKIYDFLGLTVHEIFSIITGNSINYCSHLKFITYVRDGHCDYSPWAPKT